MIETRLSYIHENPVRAGLVAEAEDYLYSSARNYAENAIENLLDELKSLGSKKANIEICLIGGANVIKKENDTIADNLICSIFEIVEQNKLNVKKTHLGGRDTKDALQN